MAIDTMPRTPGTREAPGRPTAPGGALPPDGTLSPGRTAPDQKPGSPRTRPVSAPRHTRPITGPGSGPVTRPATGPRARPRHPRAPFILLLVGLLGGALVSLLVISTTLAEGSFQITTLQQQSTNLARQEQLLSQQVARASSPAQIAQEAEQLGMQQDPNLRFINLKTGKVVSGKVSKADAEISVPGYNP